MLAFVEMPYTYCMVNADGTYWRTSTVHVCTVLLFNSPSWQSSFVYSWLVVSSRERNSSCVLAREPARTSSIFPTKPQVDTNVSFLLSHKTAARKEHNYIMTVKNFIKELIMGAILACLVLFYGTFRHTSTPKDRSAKKGTEKWKRSHLWKRSHPRTNGESSQLRERSHVQTNSPPLRGSPDGSANQSHSTIEDMVWSFQSRKLRGN